MSTEELADDASDGMQSISQLTDEFSADSEINNLQHVLRTCPLIKKDKNVSWVWKYFGKYPNTVPKDRSNYKILVIIHYKEMKFMMKIMIFSLN